MPILDRLRNAQGGHAFVNLARAFHLPPTKVEASLAAMTGPLLSQISGKLRSRRFLARLVELLGERAHLLVLENPTLLGATSTQVLGNQALNVIAGREASKRIARQAADQSGVSEMVAEYLLPVVAAMLVGALAQASREALEALTRSGGDDADPARAPAEPASIVAPLPQVAAGGVGFSGSTGGGVGLSSPAPSSERLAMLAESIREGIALPGGRDAADSARRVLAPYVALPRRPLDWIARLRTFGGAFKTSRARKRH